MQRSGLLGAHLYKAAIAKLFFFKGAVHFYLRQTFWFAGLYPFSRFLPQKFLVRVPLSLLHVGHWGLEKRRVIAFVLTNVYRQCTARPSAVYSEFFKANPSLLSKNSLALQAQDKPPKLQHLPW